jgi:acetolactate decarboxylase
MLRLQILVLVLFTAIATNGLCETASKEGTVYQVSTITALKQGTYDGDITIGELKKHGDFGLGIFNHIDGEMIAVDGQFYQAKADGKVYKVQDAAKTPFADVCFFRQERRIVLLKLENLKKIKKVLDKIIPSIKGIHAIRIRGLFPFVKVRSVRAQQKPYPGLAEVIKQQIIFELHNVRGTLVGFRFPRSMAGINEIGYHFHFITDDKQAGGHVLDCAVNNPNVESAPFPNFLMTFSPINNKAQQSGPRIPEKILKSLKTLPQNAQ